MRPVALSSAAHACIAGHEARTADLSPASHIPRIYLRCIAFRAGTSYLPRDLFFKRSP
jgi:hypothetical protein